MFHDSLHYFYFILLVYILYLYLEKNIALLVVLNVFRD